MERTARPRCAGAVGAGYFFNATVNGFSFESSIVPRQKKFYLLIDAEASKSAGVSEGGVVEVAVKPYAE